MLKLTRLLVLMLLLGLLVVAVFPAMAQDTIEYGDVVEGEIEEESEVEYFFEGAAGDVIVAHLWSTNLDDDLTAITLELRDANGDDIITSSYTLREATVSAVLEDDGEYSIAVITDTSYGGEYALAVYNLEVLGSGDTAEGSIDGDSEDQYFAVSGEDDVTVVFAFEDAERFVPSFRVYNAEDFSLVGYFVSVVEDATGGINLPGGEDMYIIAVEYSASDLLIYDGMESDFFIAVE